MEILIPIAIGTLFGCGCYLVLRRNIVRVLLGIMLFSQAANLLIFAGAGLTPGEPPVIPGTADNLAGAYADPLPQALVLTAIVIGFAVLAFAIVLVLRAFQSVGSDDLDQFNRSDS